MQAYAETLRAGDRLALTALYSASGAFVNGSAPAQLDSLSTIAKFYAGESWQKPDAFDWIDLHFDPIGIDGCVITGGFNWTQGGKSDAHAYTAVLRREGRAWRIRLEHENLLPSPRERAN